MENIPSDPPTILIIDDDPTNRKVLGIILSNFRIITAPEGETGIRYAEEIRPHLILLDLLMPEMDGFEVCRRLKNNQKTSDIPVIIISAISEPREKVKGFELGAADYITRPFFKEEVYARIQTQLTLRIQQLELQQSEALKNLILSSTKEMFLLFDLDMKIRWVNKAASETMGLTPEEMIGTYCYEILHHRFAPCPDCPVVLALETGISQEGEMITPDGRHWLLRGYPICDERGKINGLVEFILDMTDSKQAQDALKKSEKRLKRSEWELEVRNRIAQTFLTSPDEKIYERVIDIILETLESQYGLFGYIDEAEKNLMAVSLSQNVIWEKCRMEKKQILFPHKSWKGSWGDALKQKRSILSNQPGNVPKGHMEIENAISVPILYQKRRQGLLTIANKRGGYHKADQQLLESIAGYIAPILNARLQRDQEEKQRKLLEEQLATAQKREAIGTLAGGIAHDFNNILFPIIGYAEMMIDSFDLEPRVAKNIDQILIAALRAKDLVAHILTFSRNYEKEMAPVQIGPIVKESLKLLRATIPANIFIRQDIEETGSIIADLTQIHQIVINLCTNAYHAMQQSGGILEVSLKETEIDPKSAAGLHPEATAGSYLLLSVQDTGTGMDPTILNKIFEPYFTTKQPDKGTGLGLAVVDGIVRDHQGFMSLSTELGKGSIFSVYFPLCHGEIQEKTAPKVLIGTGGAEHIFLVDDEKLIVEMLTQMLQGFGYRVTTRSSSLDALSYLNENRYEIDLVITDMAMPGITGDLLTRKIKEIRKDLPVIICTGYSDQIDEDRAREMGADGFLLKPIIRGELAKTIHRVLHPENAESRTP